MKTEEEKFDDFLKNKLENGQVLFKEEYWENARIMLDANRPKRRRFGFIIFMSVLFMVAVSAVLFNHGNNLAPPSSSATNETAPGPVQTGIETTTNVKDMHPDEILISSNENPLQASSAALSTPAGLPQQKVGRSNPHEEKQDQRLTASMQLQQAGNSNEIPNQVQSGELAREEMIDNNRLADIEGDISTADVHALAPGLAVLIEPRWKTELEITGYEATFVDRPKRPGKRRGSYKMLEAGVNYYNPGTTASENINMHAGIKYCLAIAPRLSLASGVSYSRQHISYGKRTYNSISYGFGENRETVGINTTRLSYVEVPLTLLYSIKGKHGLTGGVSFNYLVQSSDLIKPRDKTSFSERASGHFGAFNRFDVQLHAGYTYAFNSRILLSASYYGSVTDVTKNSSFKSAGVNTNKGLRLTIGYQLY